MERSNSVERTAEMDVTKGRYRWGLVLSAFVVMMVISIYQYSWFLFAFSIKEEYGWDLAAIGLTFTVFTYTATFVQPFSGYLADTYGPRLIALASCVVVGLGLIFASFTTAPGWFYVCYGIGGLAVGVLYGISTACAIKWFPDRRGFATGLVVFGFGAGTAVFNLFIQQMLESWGLSGTFRFLGVAMMVCLVPLSLVYKYPAAPARSKTGGGPAAQGSQKDYKPREMLSTYQWYLIYFSFIFTVSIVLLFGAQMKMLAKEYNIPPGYFQALLILFPLGNGLSRVVSGFISDRIGRGRTMMLFYSLLGVSIICFVYLATSPFLFVAIVFLASLLGGAPFALYPSTIGDFYGTGYATTNYGLTYTAKAWAGLVSGWLSGYLVMRLGSYHSVLLVMAVCALVAAVASNPRWMKRPERAG